MYLCIFVKPPQPFSPSPPASSDIHECDKYNDGKMETAKSHIRERTNLGEKGSVKEDLTK